MDEVAVQMDAAQARQIAASLLAPRETCCHSAASWLDADGVLQGSQAGQQVLGRVGAGPASEQGG
jgi:hypothetical protein